jgi:hypothetical protein
MKNVFLALLLANLLFFGWQQWIAPPDVPPLRLRSPGPEQEIAQAPTSRGGTAGAAAGASDRSCMRIGPLTDGPLADTLRGRLADQGFEAVIAAEEGQVWVGHWVQIENVPSREEADRIAARLAAGGLPDAYVLQNSPPFSVSLGVFRARDRADKVAVAAGALGFHPQTTDRYRAGTQYWLTVTVPAGRTLPLADLGRQSGQILRSDQVACPTDSAGVAKGNQ